MAPCNPVHPRSVRRDRHDVAAVNHVPYPDPAVLSSGGGKPAPQLNGKRKATEVVPTDAPRLAGRSIGKPHAASRRHCHEAVALHELNAHDRFVEPERSDFLNDQVPSEPPLQTRPARNPSVSAARSRSRPMKIIRLARGSAHRLASHASLHPKTRAPPARSPQPTAREDHSRRP